MLKKLHFIIPIVGLILVNFIYFYPALQGKVISQGDIIQGKGTARAIVEYREVNDDEPLWTDRVFSGMPAFQISTRYPNNWLTYPAKIIAFVGGDMAGIHIIFTLMFGFYLLMISMKMNPWLSAIGAIAFAYSAFFIISFEAGHNAKVRTAAFVAPVIMGVLLTYRKKYLLGFALTALFLGLNINSNHFQVTYYLAIILLIIAAVELVFSYKEKAMANFWKASGILVVAAVVGAGPNISNLWSTMDYTKETMRGGSSELTHLEDSKGGLTFDYAMSWSSIIPETFNLFMANFTGGGVSQTYEGTEAHDTYFKNIVGSLTSRGTPRKQAEAQANQYLGSMFYWGESMVNGGYYLGAVVFFLFVLGFFVIKGRIKWWVAIVTVLAVIMSWGKHFQAFNEILFNYLPMYNKFRVPSYALIMTFVVVPFFGFYTLGSIINGNYDKVKIKKQLLNALYVSGGICLFFIVTGSFFFDFIGPRDTQLAEQGIDVSILESDRYALMRNSALKTIIFCGLTFGLVWMYVQEKLKLSYALAALALLVIADQWSFDKQHLSAENFVSDRTYDNTFTLTAADQTILQDTDPHYRVFNTTASLTGDAYTSYYHNSVSGYHGAKLIRYQDLIDNQLSKSNMACFNMLNAKWFIVGDKNTGQKAAQQNPNACGAAWLVEELNVVPNADAEMAALTDFDPKKTAVVDQRYQQKIPSSLSHNPASTIKIVEPGMKKMVYEANIAGPEEFAVFSEIYYEGGNNDWKAFIDNEPVDHIRVNYLLRGMTIPQGKHTIEFRFEPRSYIIGEKISLVFSIIIFIALGLVGILAFKQNKNTEAAA